MQINKLIDTALGKFIAVVILAVIIGGIVMGYQYYNSTAKFSLIAKIPVPTEYNLTNTGNQSAYERLTQAYSELAKLKGQDLYKADIINAAISRANAFMDLGDTGRAILAYQWLNKYRSGGLQGFNNLANIYVSIGEYQKAETNYLIAIKNSQGIMHIEPYEGLFNLYRDHLKDKFPQIEKVLLTAIASTPSPSPNFYNLLGQYYESVGRTGDAIVQYKEVLKADSTNSAIKAKIKELEGK